jgi:hypothetical protein
MCGQTSCQERDRLYQQKGPIHPRNPGRSVGEMEEAHGRLIGTKRQPQAPMLRVTDSGPERNGGGCTINQLGQYDVCISTHSDHCRDVTEVAAPQAQDDPPGSGVASTKWYPVLLSRLMDGLLSLPQWSKQQANQEKGYVINNQRRTSYALGDYRAEEMISRHFRDSCSENGKITGITQPESMEGT